MRTRGSNMRVILPLLCLVCVGHASCFAFQPFSPRVAPFGRGSINTRKPVLRSARPSLSHRASITILEAGMKNEARRGGGGGDEENILDGRLIVDDQAREKSDIVQEWLEDLYDRVDYHAALIRAGVIPEGTPRFDEDVEVDMDDEVEDVEWNEDEMVDMEGIEEGEREEEEMEIDESEDLLSDIEGEVEGKEGELTYGEMDLPYFLSILREEGYPKNGGKFLDLGCGRGQLVLAAAREGRWDECVGIEIMPEVLEIGRGAVELALKESASGSGTNISPCSLYMRDMYTDSGLSLAAEADFIFAYATCFETCDGLMLAKLSRALSGHVRKGTCIVTINKTLDPTLGFKLRTKYLGPNPDSISNDAVAYVYDVVG